ncbi:DNA/RNA non-specific endonuclease [Patulibacter medicamentivorans]|uniref:DNA/RNA non-specific endonuclease n=1 Tax=Patulibacter medicamentivorans TaxID=1097667 RepID=H0DZT4_9ACTN|nr:DNA/RNA non-specific endonuclease [Patulibacter medicamentivorans]EHN13038.1 DNA/RNA non-specific endonuclease [Patulibacter medicamentivorans]
MRKRDLKDRQRLQAAVRQVADQYLPDPNITSVGVGYKVEGGERTDTLALQFTVGVKLAPEGLEAVATRPIPASITANGVTFATDVVERTFEQHPAAVALEAKAERKARVDPLVPGVSVANARVSAGTLGCLVSEPATGAVRILSNWHVLHGDAGRIGDPIVQPGPYDDNRIAANGCGTLIRSFLGLAGDCAIASVEHRRADERILGLGVAVRRIGEPELGDVVVKSGRTTDVTYGTVTRIHTITKLVYGARGEQRIGGFEIGVDPDHEPPNGEISMGGDSGSAWMAVDDAGAASEMLLGLHFAGETVEPAEYAVACYASAVFEKLEIAPIAAPEGVADAERRPVVDAAAGYDPAFLPGHAVPLPKPTATVKRDYAPTTSGSVVRDYTHFSLAMSKKRRFCRWVAWNIDGARMQQLSRKDQKFVLDPQYDAKHQVGDELYAGNRLDRGHIARRADLLWGDRAAQANSDSFFFTNITPQLDDFNQSSKQGLWGELENAIFEDVDVDDLRVNVIGGPIFKPDDLPYRDVLVPRSFWKLIAYVEDGTLKAKAFQLTQDDLEAKLESLGLEPFNLYQVTVADLARLTGLDFGPLRQADTMPPAPEDVGGPAVRRIDARSQVAAG